MEKDKDSRQERGHPRGLSAVALQPLSPAHLQEGPGGGSGWRSGGQTALTGLSGLG